jgi:alanine racemase
MTDSSPPADGAALTAGAVLTVDLDAIAANYCLLRDRLGTTACAAVVKADAYGLGADRVAPALHEAGCRRFFVALLDEGIALRRALPEAEIYVFIGPLPGTAPVYREHRLIPVLNDLGQVERWQRFGGGPLPAVLQIDTGMNRLGLGPDESARLVAEPERLAGIDLRYVMSHLVSAEIADDALNRTQLDRFVAVRDKLPALAASLANSSGIFLGPAFHFDLARPGAALYGVNPTPGAPNPMRNVVRLEGRIVQVRDVDSPMTVGYGATHRVAKKGKIATISVGYADGYLRSLSGRGSCQIGGVRVPVVGRVSMDLITVDVSNVPMQDLEPGGFAALLGDDHGVDDLAREGGTIGYEILTALGRRYHRHYLGS